MPSPRGTPSRRNRTGAEDAGSPVTPSRRSARTAANAPTTPSQETATPSRSARGGNNEVETPMRMGANARNNLGGRSVRVESSDTLNVPTSPALPATSPGGVGLHDIDLSSPLNYGTPSSMGSIRTPRSGIRGTPMRARPDIRQDRLLRQVNIGSDALDPIAEQRSDITPSGEAAPHLVIWGTDVVVSECKRKFTQFLLRYIDMEIAQDEMTENINLSEPFYMQKLEEIHSLEEPFLNINCAHLKTFDEGLYRQLICYPQEVIPTFDMAINEMFFERYPAAILEHQIQVRPFNAEKTRNMRALNPEDIDQLISISGMVIRTSNIIPEMREAFFKCIVCSFTTTVEIDRGRIHEPTLCSNCNTNHCFQMVHNRSQFTDKQMIKLQESPDDMAAGQTPHNVLLFAHNDLVDKVQAGDRVTVTGIYRAIPIQEHPRARNVKSVYRTHIDVVHFRKIDSKRLYEEEEG